MKIYVFHNAHCHGRVSNKEYNCWFEFKNFFKKIWRNVDKPNNGIHHAQFLFTSNRLNKKLELTQSGKISAYITFLDEIQVPSLLKIFRLVSIRRVFLSTFKSTKAFDLANQFFQSSVYDFPNDDSNSDFQSANEKRVHHQHNNRF